MIEMFNKTFFVMCRITSASIFRISDEGGFYSLVMITVMQLYVASLAKDRVGIGYSICLEIFNGENKY